MNIDNLMKSGVVGIILGFYVLVYSTSLIPFEIGFPISLIALYVLIESTYKLALYRQDSSQKVAK